MTRGKSKYTYHDMIRDTEAYLQKEMLSIMPSEEETKSLTIEYYEKEEAQELTDAEFKAMICQHINYLHAMLGQIDQRLEDLSKSLTND